MRRTLFTHVRVFDGTGAAPYAADVLVQDERIAEINRGAESPATPPAGAVVVDGKGATLMPGLIEAHAHLSWPSSVERFVPGMALAPDDLVLNTARNARVLLDHGFTSAYSGGARQDCRDHAQGVHRFRWHARPAADRLLDRARAAEHHG